MLRRIPLGKMMNLRDLGGYPLPGGGHTAWGRVLRGDNPSGLTEAELQWLRDRAITTVVDLRSAQELERRPDQLRDCPGFTYWHVPLVGGERLPNLEADVGKSYFEMLERREHPAQALRVIAQAPGGVLFHCMAGKDRTGCIAALLLSLAGVKREDILADYQMTEIYIGEMVRKIREIKPDSAPFLGQSRVEYLEDCLNRLTEAHGSVAGYLEWLGLTGEELASLRGKLVQEAQAG